LAAVDKAGNNLNMREAYTLLQGFDNQNSPAALISTMMIIVIANPRERINRTGNKTSQ
jgi:hypothetical protein